MHDMRKNHKNVVALFAIAAALILTHSPLMGSSATSQAAEAALKRCEEAGSRGDPGNYWCERAARLGNATAQAHQGTWYSLLGRYTEAFRWYRLAADQGDAGGMLGLGRIYEFGEGVKEDLVEAFKWLSLGVSRLPKDEVEMREYIMREELHPLTAKMTLEQIDEAKRRAAEWEAAHPGK
jgi:TPR repeat protein